MAISIDTILPVIKTLIGLLVPNAGDALDKLQAVIADPSLPHIQTFVAAAAVVAEGYDDKDKAKIQAVAALADQLFATIQVFQTVPPTA